MACHWATHLDQLAAYREKMRPVMAASPVCDGRQFTRHLEKAFREMWRRFCSDAPRDTLIVSQLSDAN
jgi:predicted O-linked N-acetylglucosamine transferase (SPINDLY family)